MVIIALFRNDLYIISDYPIVTISEREPKTVYVGDDIDLVCSVDSNPPSTLSWHNHEGIIKGYLAYNLNVLKIKRRSIYLYTIF
jgi:hypothetical protein